ncbi:MAG: sugar ABC transporter ATP-binding protein [Terracidiphilus sp.]
MSQAPASIILEARAVTRRYPGTLALDAVDFRVYRNQVNVLIGENGAGKSTLMRILAGVETPDGGQLFLEGVPIVNRSPREAAQHGIAIVHQELAVLPNLDIAQNIFAGREPVHAGVLIHRSVEERRSAEALQRLRKPMDVHTSVGHLPLGRRQIVELARTLDLRSQILILDEPTSALSNAEAESLFAVIAELKQAGVTIIYISHRLNELLLLGDQFTVLRSGRVVGEAPRAAVTRQWIVERMSGRDITALPQLHSAIEHNAPLLRVDSLRLSPQSDSGIEQVQLSDISFTLRKGEVLGIYGLLGAGRTELLEALAGSRPAIAGTVQLNDDIFRPSSVSDAIHAGIHLVPEDRQRDGLIPELSIRENIALAASGGLFLDRKRETAQVLQLARQLNIAAPDLEVPVTALSGGNQQKVLIARCLMRSPALLLLDEPTRGVDVGAKTEIYGILRQLADQGIGVIFTSSEIEETQALADRALVLCQGRISADLKGSQMTDEALFAAASPEITLPATTETGIARA